MASPLVALANEIFAMVAPGGWLGLSGILPSQSDDVVSAYTAAGFESVRVEQELDGWILVTGRKMKQ